MDEERKNLLGDFVISSVMGGVVFFTLIFISFMTAITFLIILSIFK